MERATLRAQCSCDARGAGPGERFHLLRQRFVGAIAAASQGAAGPWVGRLWAPARLRGGGVGVGGYSAAEPSSQVLARDGSGYRFGLASRGDCGSRLRSQRRLGGRRDGGRWSRVDRGTLEPERLGQDLLPQLGESANALGVSAYLPGGDGDRQRLLRVGSRMGWYAWRSGSGRPWAPPWAYDCLEVAPENGRAARSHSVGALARASGGDRTRPRRRAGAGDDRVQDRSWQGPGVRPGGGQARALPPPQRSNQMGGVPRRRRPRPLPGSLNRRLLGRAPQAARARERSGERAPGARPFLPR